MSPAHAADLAFAAAAPPGGAQSQWSFLVMMVAMFAIFYFLLIRPQQKQKREREQMLASLKRGDRVVTTGGLHGTIAGLDEQKVVLRVTDQVRLEFDRASIGRVVERQGDRSA